MRNSRTLWTLVLLITFVGLTVSAQELVRRQDEKTTSDATRVTSTAADKVTLGIEITRAPSQTDATGTGSKNTGDGTKDSGNTSGDQITATRSRTRTAQIPANSPPGGVSMKSPAATDGFQLYPIGTQITWSYNYTSLLVSPTAINVEAFCSRTQQTYTIASNYSIAKTTVVWDTEEYEKTGRPLIAQATYTLYMYDSSTQVTDIPKAGHLGLYRSFNFAMYTPAGNIPLSDYKCLTCNNASSLFDSHSVRVLLATSLFVTAGFAWFIHGAM